MYAAKNYLPCKNNTKTQRGTGDYVGLWGPLRFRSPGVSTEELHPLAGATDDDQPRGSLQPDLVIQPA